MSTGLEWGAESDQASRLVGAAIRLTRTLRALTRVSAYSGPQISALSVILVSGKIVARDLARIEEVTPATISRLVATLEDAGLVQRRADATDARKQWISATPKGEAVVVQGHARRIAPLAQATAALSDEDRVKLDEGLRIIEALIAKTTATP